jgi:hypothetical protein
LVAHVPNVRAVPAATIVPVYSALRIGDKEG